MKTVLLMSRGRRLGALYSAIARDLSRDHRVVALIDTSERDYWSELEGVEAMTLAEAAGTTTAPAPGDLARFVADIETETGLRVYQAARNYLIYGRLHSELFGWRSRRWLWRDEASIVDDYVLAYRAMDRIFRDYSPAIILLEAPDHIYASLTQAIAAKRGILCLGVYFAPLAGNCSMFLYTGFQPHNVLLRYYYDNPDQIPPSGWTTATRMIAQIREQGPPAIAYVSDMQKRSRSIVMPLLAKTGGAVLSPSQWGRLSPPALHSRARALSNEFWLKRHLRSDIPDRPYVLYFLQHQPEASAATQAPHFVDQSLLIEQFAVNAPAGWRIVVKEHPRTYPARGRAFFRPLLDLPNVHLCRPDVPSRQLLEQAAVVVTLTGSVGMEALFAGKKVAVVGRPYYSFFPGVSRLDRPADLFDAIEAIEPRAADDPLLQRFAAAYYSSVFDAGTLAPDGIWPRPEEGGPNIAAGLRRHLELLDRGALNVSDFPVFQR